MKVVEIVLLVCVLQFPALCIFLLGFFHAEEWRAKKSAARFWSMPPKLSKLH